MVISHSERAHSVPAMPAVNAIDRLHQPQAAVAVYPVRQALLPLGFRHNVRQHDARLVVDEPALEDAL
jgi:hypothetical protein